MALRMLCSPVHPYAVERMRILQSRAWVSIAAEQRRRSK